MKKVLITLILMAALTLYLVTIPPQHGRAQTEQNSVPPLTPKVKQLQRQLDKKTAIIKELAAKKQEAKPKIKVVNHYVRTTPRQITVYTRIDGEVTEHKVNNNDGFFVLDLEPEMLVQPLYIDTCIEEHKNLWQRILKK